jgi:tetratricopeptide (TPR) repeat protein
MGANDLPGALASFKKATEQAPKAYGYALNLARAHLLNRDLNAAFDVLNGVLKADPKFLPALTLAAAASLQAGQGEKAAGYVARMHQVAPDAPGTLAMEGDLLMAQKRYREALDLYRKAYEKSPSRELVFAQYRAGVLTGVPHAEKVLEDYVAANPKDVEATVVLAEYRQSQGQADAAIALYEQALAQGPGNAMLWNNLAVIYQSKGDPKAVAIAEKAYKAEPKAAPIQDTYGWILFESGDNEKALSLLGEAAKGLPDNAEVQYHYAAALAKKGNTAEAVALLKKAVKGPMPAGAKADAQKLLQQLSK